MTTLWLHRIKCFSTHTAQVTLAPFRITAFRDMPLRSASLRATSLRIATLRASPVRIVPHEINSTKSLLLTIAQ